MTAPRHCDDHVRLERELAESHEARRALVQADTETAKAVDKFDRRLQAVEKRIAIWGGALAALAALPWLLKLLGAVIPAARAAVGG
jgi:hypothetical protein